jgi:hypothetical protein
MPSAWRGLRISPERMPHRSLIAKRRGVAHDGFAHDEKHTRMECNRRDGGSARRSWPGLPRRREMSIKVRCARVQSSAAHTATPRLRATEMTRLFSMHRTESCVEPERRASWRDSQAKKSNLCSRFSAAATFEPLRSASMMEALTLDFCVLSTALLRLFPPSRSHCLHP